MTHSIRRRVVAVVAALLLGAAGTARAQLPTQAIQPGDRILLHVVGEPQYSDTFTVSAGPALVLPALGTVPLAGVPRDSLTPYLTTFLANYLNHPVVEAQVLMRLGIVGEVARPGFYALPSDAVLEDLIMAAGGLTAQARFERVDLVRADAVLIRGDAIRRAMVEGRTVDALALRSGDVMRIPRRPDQESRVRILTGLVTLPLAIYGITRLF